MEAGEPVNESITTNQVFNSIQDMVNDSRTLKPKSIGIIADFRERKLDLGQFPAKGWIKA